MTPGPSDARRVLLLGRLDGYANGRRSAEIRRFLVERGHQVDLVDTAGLALSERPAKLFGRTLPGARPGKIALYTVETVAGRLLARSGLLRRHCSYRVMLARLRLRRALLGSQLPLDDYDLVICEYPADAEVLAVPASARTLYDCPTPWADEQFFEGNLTPAQHRRLRRREAALLEGVDHLSFHWESYARYAVGHYGISGANLLTLNHGCTPAAHRAAFADPLRVVYLGFLGMRVIDLPQLARLSARYPHLDVYGGPPPDPALGLRYLGYAPDPEILRRYQLGIVTSGRDPLREDGFSAKHVQYLAYGLPVLVPAWRRQLDLLRGSVPYTEENFLAVLDSLRDERRWQALSDEAYAQARRLSWDETLRPLARLLDGRA